MQVKSIAKLSIATSIAIGSLLTGAASAQAASCYDLWLKRNEIYHVNGYCFRSRLGHETFGNSNCWTSNPKLSSRERRMVAKIKRQEAKKGCRVN